MENKVYTRRDSATAFLKKQGIPKAAYDRCINKFKDAEGDLYEVDLKVMQQVLDEAKKPEPVVERRTGMDELVNTLQQSSTTLKKAVKALSGKKRRTSSVRTVSSVARELILKGQSNSEVWKALQAEFKLPDSKKHYPAWYRSEVKRQGLMK